MSCFFSKQPVQWNHAQAVGAADGPRCLVHVLMHVDVVARFDTRIHVRRDARHERRVVAVGILKRHRRVDQLGGVDGLAIVRRIHRHEVEVRRRRIAVAAAHGAHGLAVEFFGDAQVFDGQRLLGKSAGKNYRGPATGFEQFVCLGVTNAWAVPVLLSSPKKVDERLMHKALKPSRHIETAARSQEDDSRLMARTQQRSGFCWMSQDTRRPRTQRGNPGLRKTGSGASIEAAHVTDYDRFSISPKGSGRVRSGPTAAGALRTNG